MYRALGGRVNELEVAGDSYAPGSLHHAIMQGHRAEQSDSVAGFKAVRRELALSDNDALTLGTMPMILVPRHFFVGILEQNGGDTGGHQA
jgi:hypothetical protein